MQRIVIKKAIEMVITIFIATIIIFVLIRLSPSNPAKIIVLRQDTATTNTAIFDEKYEELRERFELNKSIPQQYIIWLKRVFSLDFGNSFYTNIPVKEEILRRIPATFLLTLPALAIEIFIGVIFGTISAINNKKITDKVIRFFSVVFSSTPAFAISLMLVYFFGVHKNIFKITNDASIERLWLPSITLAIIQAPMLIRMIRMLLLDEFGKTYIGFGLTRGLGRKWVIKNAFKNMLIPLISIISLTFVSLIGGAVIIESVFTWPGIGKYVLDSVLVQDYPVVQAYSLIMVCLITFSNFLTDLSYVFIDPKIRLRKVKNEKQK